ncbi:Calmodulin binding protein-like protein [Rhynchospora pubera]|uniref:Calmodulin binding protein-like protein n=1 Tax=Rhynchospora pubera TaxID=906938 RepID=A0AAV8G1I0_9POAL|nr:Calmodulin binding protein-like protein [Rhynchospora pubera]
MVLIEQFINEAEASGSAVGARGRAGAGAQRRQPTKPSKLYHVINYAYVYEKIKKKFASCMQESADNGAMAFMMKELAGDLAARMHLSVPKLQYAEPPPAQELRFTNLIPAEVFTNRPLVGADNNPLQIELVNIESGEICQASSLEVEVFVTRGNFPSHDQKLRKCKALSPRPKAMKPLLVQAIATKTARKCLSRKTKFVVKLQNGKAVVNGKITDNSKWVRTGMFKLVARVTQRRYQGRRIKEAISKAFTVSESRLEGRKHEIPYPEDETCKLINVGKEYQRRLKDINIKTVQDFLNKLESDPDGLKKTLGMQNSKWEATVEHARKCRFSKDEINISNARGDGTGDSISHNLYNRPGNKEDTNVITMCVEEQMHPELNSESDQMEELLSNISIHGNSESNEISEGMGEQSTIQPHFVRFFSNQWIKDYYID